MHVCGLTLLCTCLVIMNADQVFTFSLLYFMMHPAFNKKGKCNATLLLHNVCSRETENHGLMPVTIALGYNR